MRVEAGVLAAAAGPRQWCRAAVRRTAAVDHLDAGVRAVCAVRTPVPRLVAGPLLGRSLDECTRGQDAPPAPVEDEQAPARRAVPRPEPRAEAASGTARSAVPSGRTAPVAPVPGPAPLRRVPLPTAEDCVSPQRLAELAGAVGQVPRGAGRGPATGSPASAAVARPAATPRGGGAGRSAAGRTGTVRALPPRPPLPALPDPVTRRLAARAGLDPVTAARTARTRTPGATPAEQDAVRAALVAGPDAPAVPRDRTPGPAPDQRPATPGRPDRPTPSATATPGIRPALPDLPPAAPGSATAAAPAPGDRVPTALPSLPPRVADDDGLPLAVPGPADRHRPAVASAPTQATTPADRPAGQATGAGVIPAPALPAPELERLLDQVLTDAARRHGIEV